MFLTQWFRENLRGIPWTMLLTVYALLTIGLYNLYSATGANVTPDRFFTQINWILIGTGLMIVIGVFIDIRTVERLNFFGYKKILTVDKKNLDLRSQKKVSNFFFKVVISISFPFPELRSRI
jgi:cell division protein FtsW (lipid II flippase)